MAAPPVMSKDMPAGIVEVGASAVDAQLPGTATAAAAEGATNLVIRTGNATIQVDSLEPAMARVRAIAARLGGFVANASLAAGREQVRSATLELKVPAARYDDLVNALSPIGRVETVNVTAEDVGEEYVDVAARVANARRLEERLVALLATRTGKLTDVLEVEQQLARVREEIERYDGRMRWLKAHAAVSTLTVSVHEPPPVVGPSPAAEPIRDAFRQAWRNAVALAASVIAASGIYVPLAALAAFVWYVVGPRRRTARAQRA
jgi:acetolactate synthase regulatory subunit